MTETAREAAERRLAQEERGARDRRLAALQQEETDRRDRERRKVEAERRRVAAEKEAARLAAERGELEDRAQRQIEELGGTISELEDLDREHMRALRESGRQSYPPSFGGRVRRWLADWLPEKRLRASTLRELDGLSPDPATPERRP